MKILYVERVRENEQAGLRLALRRRQYRNLSIEGATVIPSSSSSCSKDICRRVFKTSPIWSLEQSKRRIVKGYICRGNPSRRPSYFALLDTYFRPIVDTTREGRVGSLASHGLQQQSKILLACKTDRNREIYGNCGGHFLDFSLYIIYPFSMSGMLHFFYVCKNITFLRLHTPKNCLFNGIHWYMQ